MPALSRKLLIAFGALGLAASAAAAWVPYHLLVNPDYTSFCDIRVLVSAPLAMAIALLFLAGAGSAIAYFPRLQAGSATQAQAPKLTQDQRSEFERWWDLQPKVEVPYPRDGAKVLVVKFNDYQ